MYGIVGAGKCYRASGNVNIAFILFLVVVGEKSLALG